MKKRPWFMKTVALCATVLFFNGCSTPVTGLKQDPSFNLATATTGGIAVGGVGHAVKPYDVPQMSRYSDLLTRVLDERCKHLRIQPVSAVFGPLGLEAYGKLLREYQMYGHLGPEHIKSLNSMPRQFRYLVMARVIRDQTEQERSQRDVWKDGKKKDDWTEITLSTEREVTGAFEIYDLQQGMLVWSGEISKSDSRSTSFTREDADWEAELIGATVGAVLSQATGGKTHDGYPTAPAFDKLLERVFRGFAENIPKPSK